MYISALAICRYQLNLNQMNIMQEIEEYLPSFIKWADNFTYEHSHINHPNMKLKL